jgi:hypothetical protein
VDVGLNSVIGAIVWVYLGVQFVYVMNKVFDKLPQQYNRFPFYTKVLWWSGALKMVTEHQAKMRLLHPIGAIMYVPLVLIAAGTILFGSAGGENLIDAHRDNLTWW